ncbi:class I heat shock-like protein [Cinnamomum micranthum f. kanehirae]|uniref:Class I heat shock-like protein n=1 Tax=Cinnamomum micranthum f. kanehirae TaxID=337451 RepID=A0A3S3MT09_9MAGN|nr:class I heat shock-like protein [Cinnamomum micranthum f. kanehirae]
MSIIPSFFGGRRSNVMDPMSFDIWDPLKVVDPWQVFCPSRDQASALANVRIDWKETPEAHIIKADLPGMNKVDVKVEVDEGRVLQISERRAKRRKRRPTSGIGWRGSGASS